MITSAKGFGQEPRFVEASDTQTNRVELEPFQLMPADQRIAGVVLDEEDKPVARASIYTYGDKQPNLNALTDAKGQFSLDKVCAGPIQLSANSRNGGYGNATAEGGDTNVVIRLRNMRLAGVVSRAGAPSPSPQGQALARPGSTGPDGGRRARRPTVAGGAGGRRAAPLPAHPAAPGRASRRHQRQGRGRGRTSYGLDDGRGLQGLEARGCFAVPARLPEGRCRERPGPPGVPEPCRGSS